MTTQYIPDLVGVVAEAVNTALNKSHEINVSYEFGNLFDIKRALQEKDQSPVKPDRFPLVWLVTPFEEVHDRADLYSTQDLRFIIANDTQQDYHMDERRDKVFLPILYPVFAELVKQIEKSTAFVTQGEPFYKKTDMQLARVDREGKHLLNDAADVIDVTFQKLQIRKKFVKQV